jgi:iron complex outermembrane receptor protein
MAIARKTTLACLITLLCAGQLVAQTGSISGQVTDAMTTEPIADARVEIEGTQRGTTAGPDGTFLLSGVAAGTHRVTARLIGYAPATLELTVSAGLTTTAQFALQRQAVVMDAIVVTGYGAQRRAAITGSVASVNADEANVGVISNADQLLQGRVAGIQITQNHGEPGAGNQIRIRGSNSITASNEPLYVIDGVVVDNRPTESSGIGIGGGAGDVGSFSQAALPRSPLNLINPNDIESITVLKDAAAAAIYGTRGANGVILIETKQGQRGRTTFEYDGYVSVGSPARYLDLLSGAEYRAFVEEQVAAGNLDPARLANLGSANTDWEREVTRTAVTHNHNVAFSGGTETTQYRASLNYMNQEGVTLSSGFERWQGRLNATHQAWEDRLQLRLNLTASHMSNDYVPFENTGGFEGGVFQNMVQFNPTQPVVEIDPATGDTTFYELGTGTQSVRNPVAMTDQIADAAGTTRVLANLRTQWEVIPTLRFQLIVGVDRSESTRREYYPLTSPVGAQWNGLARQQSRELTTTTLQTLLTWSDRFGGGHELEVIGGYEFNDYHIDQFRAETRDFLTDAFSFDNLTAGANEQAPSSEVTDNRLIGFFGRVTYGFNDKYFLTGVLRRDGSSRFGANHKWATFPAISASWRIGQEDFMRGGLFSELRFRVGYGLQGNEAVAPYASLLLLAPSDGDSYPFGDVKTVGVAPTRAANPELKWEQTSQFNIAIDYGLWNNTVSGTFEYYVKNTDDLLLTVPVPQPAVQGDRLENIGKVKNSGFEALLDAVLINKRNLTWDAGIVFAAEKNEVVDLGGRTFITNGGVSGQGQSGQVSQRILPGYALGTFYGPEFVEVNAAGEQVFNDYDASGNLVGTTTAVGADDFVVIGDANPDFTLGLRSMLTWGSFDASFIFRWEQGRDVFNNTALVHGARSNVLQDKNFLRSSLDDGDAIDQPAVFSSRWIESGSFGRLQNLTVGYTFVLPGWLSGRGNTARVFVATDNLFLITGYSGYDPEAHSSSGPGREADGLGLASRGIDYLSYPRARTFTAGIRFAF